MGLFTKGLAFQAGMRATEKGDHKTALENFIKAGNLGHPDACYNAAVCFAQGEGAEKDLDKALAWAKLAKQNKAQNADKLIGQIQALQKQAVNPKDTAPKPETKPAPKTEAPVEKTAGEMSDEEKYRKGMELFRAGDYDGAYSLLCRVCRVFGAKVDAYPDGQAAMGWMCEHGRGVEVKDSKAHLHYIVAARNGDKDGMAGFVRLTAKATSPSLKDCEAALDYAKQLGTSEAKKAVSTLEQKLAEAQLREKYAEWDLNETNVQAIFNRCLRKEGSKEITRTILFSRLLGYDEKDEIEIAFDKNILLENEKNVRYLYGQLKVVHTAESITKRLSLNDFKTTYQGTIWAQSKSSLLELLYLGCNGALGLGYRFSKKDNDTTIISSDITPTLSPKDPAFPAWWEAHKAEWEA